MIPEDGSDASLGRGAALTRFGRLSDAVLPLVGSRSPRRPFGRPSVGATPNRRGTDARTNDRAGGPGHDGGESRHRSDLQGLRAVAVLLVVAAHAGVGFLAGGYVGVDVFFVLSGFLITGLLLARAVGPRTLSFSDFYVRRARRILPAATLTLAATEIVSYFLLNFVRANQILVESTWASVFAANIYFAHHGTDYFAQGQPPSPVQHFWSLSVEEQFYLVWPALLVLTLYGALNRRARGHTSKVTRRALQRLLAVVAVGAAVSLALSIHETSVHPTSSYFSSFTRVWELAVGAMLAIAAMIGTPRSVRIAPTLRVAIGWAGLGAIAVAAVTYSTTTSFPGYAALLPVLGATLVIGAGIGSESPALGVGRVLSRGPLTYVGDRSYAFYLWHWPVLTIAALYVGHDLSVGTNLLLVGGAFLLSIVSYKYVENPIHRSHWSPAATAALWPCSMAVVVLIAVVGVDNLNSKEAAFEAAQTPSTPKALAGAAAKGTPGSAKGARAPTAANRALPAVAAAVAAAKHGDRIPAALSPPIGSLLDASYSWPSHCSAHDGETSSNLCHLGLTSARRSMVVFGDSHAEMWMPAILTMAQRDGWSVIPLSKSACTSQKWNDGHDWRECHDWYRWAVGQAQALRPDVMLVSGCCGWFQGDVAESAKTAFFSLAAAMKPYTKSVVLVGDNVGIGRQPLDCLLSRGATMAKCTTSWPSDRFSLNHDLAILSKKHGIGFVDTSGWFCSDNRCPMVVDNTIVYVDTAHITDDYAQALAGPFRAAFRTAVGGSTTG